MCGGCFLSWIQIDKGIVAKEITSFYLTMNRKIQRSCVFITENLF